MQKIKISLPIPTSKGSEMRTLELSVNENIGLNAGKDIYATARGTAKTLARKYNPFPWVWVNLWVDDKFYHMYIDNHTWVVESK
jgi:hypothetical protein